MKIMNVSSLYSKTNIRSGSNEKRPPLPANLKEATGQTGPEISQQVMNTNRSRYAIARELMQTAQEKRRQDTQPSMNSGDVDIEAYIRSLLGTE